MKLTVMGMSFGRGKGDARVLGLVKGWGFGDGIGTGTCAAGELG